MLWNLPRNGKAAQLLGKLTGRGSYFVEQFTFTVSLLPYLMVSKPDVIYFSDGNLGNFLFHWRRVSKLKYKLLFSNGGPLSAPFPYWDHVQQVAPVHREVAIAAGEPPEKHSVVAYGIKTAPELPVPSPRERAELRERLGLPVDRPIVLSVAALNASHKRMDYVVREVAQLPEPRPFLLLLGQKDDETPGILELAREQLGEGDYIIKTVEPKEVGNYYRAADIFVLASLMEGFGRVFLEAMSYGLPCLAHDYPLTRYVLGKSGYFADFARPGQLTALLRGLLADPEDEMARQARHQDVYQRFSWDCLGVEYSKMLRQWTNAR